MHICLVALNAYPAIDPTAGGPIGGIETRAWLLARGLAQLPGVKVTLVVRTPAPLREQVREGVELVSLVDPLYPLWQSVGTAIRRTSSFPWVRVQRWDPQFLWQLPRLALDRLLRGRIYAADRADPRLSRLDADVYATFGVQTHSAVVIRSAHAMQRPAALLLGSDGDLDPIFEPGGTGCDPYGTRAEVGRFILSAADSIIAQTAEQQQRLQASFGRAAHLLANPIDIEAWETALNAPAAAAVTAGFSRYVLWVGRAEEVHKRPGLCVEAARRLPEIPFLMILNRRDEAVETRIRREAPPNVRIVEQVPFVQMPQVFARAAVLLNTSQLEGFPNVFLQAALSRVPIVSLNVGAEFLRASGAGEACDGDFDRLVRRIAELWAAGPPAGEWPARDYVARHHGLAEQSARLLELLRATELRGAPR